MWWPFSSQQQQQKQSQDFSRNAQQLSGGGAADSREYAASKNAGKSHMDTDRFNSRDLDGTIAAASALARKTLEMTEKYSKERRMMMSTIEKHELEIERLKLARERVPVTSQLKQIRINPSEDLKKARTTAGSVSGSNVPPSSEEEAPWPLKVVGYVSLSIIAYWTTKKTISVVRYCKKVGLDKPPVVQETSRLSVMDVIHRPMKIVEKLEERPRPLSDLNLAPRIVDYMERVIKTAKKDKEYGGYYTNILLNGVPGPDRTVIGKTLAQHLKMNYAILNGAELARLSPGGNAIDEFFDWVETSRKDLLLFVDEADVFLGKRVWECGSRWYPSSDTTFNDRMPVRSKKLKLVLASPTYEQLYSYYQEMINEEFEYQLPGIEERERLIRSYTAQFIDQYTIKNEEEFDFAESVHEALCAKMARITKGLSRKELRELQSLYKAPAADSANSQVTEQICLDKCHEIVEEHNKFKANGLSLEWIYRTG